MWGCHSRQECHSPPPTVFLNITNLRLFSWSIGSASASHQCGLGLIPGWRSDPSAVREKGLSSPVWATLLPWGRLGQWLNVPTTSTNPIRGTLKIPRHFSKRVGESPWCWRPVPWDALITRIPADEEPLCGNAAVYAVIIIIIYYYYYPHPDDHTRQTIPRLTEQEWLVCLACFRVCALHRRVWWRVYSCDRRWRWTSGTVENTRVTWRPCWPRDSAQSRRSQTEP